MYCQSTVCPLVAIRKSVCLDTCTLGCTVLAASDVWALRGEHERSLQFARKVLREDLGAWKTDQRPPSIVRAHTSCGTALAALGQLAEAEAAFDAAISISRSCGMRTLELLALRGLHDGVRCIMAA